MGNSASRDDIPRVFTDPVTGRTVRQLTDSKNHDIGTYYDRQAWNEDTGKIVFSSGNPDALVRRQGRELAAEGRYQRGGKHSIGPLYTDDGNIYTMDDDGRNKELVVADQDFVGHHGCMPEWIPGTEMVLYGVDDIHGNSRADLVDLETGDHFVFPGMSPRMIDDAGDRLLCQVTDGVFYESTRRSDTITIMDMDTWEEVEVATVEDFIEASEHDRSEFMDPVVANLKWSPDGNEFIVRFSDQIGDNDIKELYVLDEDGSNIRQVTAASDNFHHHSWHPDGERLLYGDHTEDGPRLYFSRIDSPDEREMLVDEDLGGHPSVNPDATKVVTGGHGRGDGLVLVHLDSREVEQLTSTPMEMFHYHAIWSPDGEKVMYNADAEGTCNIYQVEFE